MMLHSLGLLHHYPVIVLDKLKSRVTTFLVELITFIMAFFLS